MANEEMVYRARACARRVHHKRWQKISLVPRPGNEARQRWRVCVLSTIGFSPINGACRAHPLTNRDTILWQTFIANRLEAEKCYAEPF